jgi:hypothetical protein
MLLLLLLQVDWDLILLMQPPTLIGAIAGEAPAHQRMNESAMHGV